MELTELQKGNKTFKMTIFSGVNKNKNRFESNQENPDSLFFEDKEDEEGEKEINLNESEKKERDEKIDENFKISKHREFLFGIESF